MRPRNWYSSSFNIHCFMLHNIVAPFSHCDLSNGDPVLVSHHLAARLAAFWLVFRVCSWQYRTFRWVDRIGEIDQLVSFNHFRLVLELKPPELAASESSWPVGSWLGDRKSASAKWETSSVLPSSPKYWREVKNRAKLYVGLSGQWGRQYESRHLSLIDKPERERYICLLYLVNALRLKMTSHIESDLRAWWVFKPRDDLDLRGSQARLVASVYGATSISLLRANISRALRLSRVIGSLYQVWVAICTCCCTILILLYPPPPSFPPQKQSPNLSS